MRSRHATLILVALVVVLALVGLLIRPRLSQTSLVGNDNVAVTSSYQLDRTVDDSLFIIAEVVELLGGSHITGDAAFVSTEVNIAGQIDGDLTVTGDVAVMQPTARVGGDVTLIVDEARLDGVIDGQITFSGKQLVFAPGLVLNGAVAVCSGDILEQRDDAALATVPCANMDLVGMVETLRANLMWQSGTAGVDWVNRTVVVVLGTVFSAFLLSGIAVLSATLFPAQLQTMQSALRQPQGALVTGVMVALLLVGVGAAFVVLLATVPALAVVVVPLGLVTAVALLALVVAGTIPLAVAIGNTLLARLTKTPQLGLFAPAVGSLVLVLVVMLPSFVPYGGLVSLGLAGLIALFALGLAVHTRLGTRSQRASVLARA